MLSLCAPLARQHQHRLAMLAPPVKLFDQLVRCLRGAPIARTRYFFFVKIASASEKVFARFFGHFFACSNLCKISVVGQDKKMSVT